MMHRTVKAIALCGALGVDVDDVASASARAPSSLDGDSVWERNHPTDHVQRTESRRAGARTQKLRIPSHILA
jgi:hypothetical protein